MVGADVDGRCARLDQCVMHSQVIGYKNEHEYQEASDEKVHHKVNGL